MNGRKEEEEQEENGKTLTKIDAEILVKISKNNMPAGRFPELPKRRWHELIPG